MSLKELGVTRQELIKAREVLLSPVTEGRCICGIIHEIRGGDNFPRTLTKWGAQFTRTGASMWWGYNKATRIKILNALINRHYDQAKDIIRRAHRPKC